MHRISALLLIACTAVPATAQQSDPDTVCASVYALLAENARTAGVDDSGFEAGLNNAQMLHLAANPTDDPQRYALSIVDSAQVLRDALTQGRLSADSVVRTASSCNVRYAQAR